MTELYSVSSDGNVSSDRLEVFLTTHRAKEAAAKAFDADRNADPNPYSDHGEKTRALSDACDAATEAFCAAAEALAVWLEKRRQVPLTWLPATCDDCKVVIGHVLTRGGEDSPAKCPACYAILAARLRAERAAARPGGAGPGAPRLGPGEPIIGTGDPRKTSSVTRTSEVWPIPPIVLPPPKPTGFQG